MRLFLLPVSTRRTLIYCERLRDATAAPGSKPPISQRIITKANDTWISWEKSETGWQKTITSWGNSLLRRIPFEEYGLKSLPSGTKARLADIDAGKLRLKCLYPAAFLRSREPSKQPTDQKMEVTRILQQLATERNNLHRQRLIWCMIGIPISAPFAILPVIPNVPMYYLIYRAYCHYKALFGARTLERLVKSNAIDMAPSERLDQMYAAGLAQPDNHTLKTLPAVSSEDISRASTDIDEQAKAGKEILLLRRWNGDLLAEELKLPELEMEIERAVEQVDAAMKKDAEVPAQDDGAKK